MQLSSNFTLLFTGRKLAVGVCVKRDLRQVSTYLLRIIVYLTFVVIAHTVWL